MKEYIRVCRDVDMEMKKQDGIQLIDRIVKDDNLWKAYKKVKANGGALGVDVLHTVHELKAHMFKYFEVLKVKLTDGTKRYLGILCLLDRQIVFLY